MTSDTHVQIDSTKIRILDMTTNLKNARMVRKSTVTLFLPISYLFQLHFPSTEYGGGYRKQSSTTHTSEDGSLGA